MKKGSSKEQDRIIVNGESMPVRANMMMQVSRTEVRIDSLTSQTLADITNDVKALQAVGKKATLLIVGRVGYMVENWEELGQGINRTALNYMADELGLSKQSTSAMNRVFKRFISDGATGALTIDGDWSYGQLMELLPMTDEEIETYIETKELTDSMSAVRIRGLVKDCKDARNSIEVHATEEKPEEKPQDKTEEKPQDRTEEKPQDKTEETEDIKVGDIVKIVNPTEEEKTAHIEFANHLKELNATVLRLIAKVGSVDGKMTKEGTELDKAYVEIIKALGYYEMVSILK